MIHKKLWLLLALLFLLEPTLLPWILPLGWQTNVEVNPHFVLVLVLYIGLYVRRHVALAYGLLFGFLYDFLLFTPMLGPTSFAMGVAGYAAGLMQGRMYSSIVMSMLVIGSGHLFYDSILYGIHRLFRVTNVSFEWIFLHQILPSMLINLLFALAIYVPVRRMFESLPGKSAEKEE
ncbi:rod shape-determining protein MreD [Paenibacillus sp. UNCCL117]|uniref:rod shape-determining protein MreD n=1 Tax=unclassified Paenibacillus TaxID=185978 RepID=UPI0008845619|nr:MULTISPECIES: rod shape-determining protein MreD [unclassified Paenibacillus]SDD24092.1 rod shape-determining protein MreD [Paenibacillus sp. cl123]SFW41553.1 rod shape-determining protein MreD [Paenibacillus sp. UNCCL117]